MMLQSVVLVSKEEHSFTNGARLLANLFKRRGYNPVIQDSCLRGGSTLSSLARNGNGISEKFQTPAAAMKQSDGTTTYDIGSPTVAALLNKNWDYIILKDHTQSPARDGSRTSSKDALTSISLPASIFQFRWYIKSDCHLSHDGRLSSRRK
jgi:hypothetical protein